MTMIRKAAAGKADGMEFVLSDATERASGIYEIVNGLNGKRYIGSAKTFGVRWRAHRAKLRKGTHANRHLQAAWAKYGEAAFEFRPIQFCSVGDLIAAEQAAIDGGSPEYNLSPTAGSTLGVRFTDETRRNISEALKGKTLGRKRDRAAVEKTAAAHRGRKRPKETSEKISARLTGRKCGPRTEEYRAAMSARLKGRPKSPEHLAAFLAGRAAYEMTEDHRAAISASVRDQYATGKRSRERSPEYREKIAAGLRGRTLTPEHRAAVSAAMLGKKRGPYKTRRTVA